MNKINYDPERNEVIITGCVDCIFITAINDIDVGCGISNNVDICDGYSVKGSFPYNCPLRDPNFKLTRVIE